MILYIIGTNGAGKTTLSVKAGPDAEMCFHPPQNLGADAETIAGIPWITVRVREGRPIQPVTYWRPNEFVTHDFKERDAVRAMLGIPAKATVVRVSADAMEAVALAGLAADKRAQAVQAIDDCLEARFDVVVHETYPMRRPRPQDRIVSLAVPYAEVRKRQATNQWNERLDLGRDYYVEAARRAVQPEHYYCHGAKTDVRLWWSKDRWRPVEEVANERFAALGNWYHPQKLAGILSPEAAVPSYEGRWQALAALFDRDLTGQRILDIGANTGYNALRLAERGASVVAVEPDARVIDQFRAVVEMGSHPVKATGRIVYHNRAAEAADLAPLGPFDTVVMSACHYYINRSVKEPYKHAGANEIRMRGLRTPLWAVLDGIRRSSARLLMPTNSDHARREKDPYPDAMPEWIKEALESMGFERVKIHPGFANTPIVEAFSNASAPAHPASAAT